MKPLRILARGWICASMLIVLLGVAAPSHASGYLVPEMDTEAMAQGSAWAARARGPSAIFFNPAGLTQLNGFALTVGTTLIDLQADFVGPQPFSFKTETENALAPPSHGYLGYKLGDNIALGVGLHTSFGLVMDWPQRWPEERHFGAYVIEKVDLKTFNINPTIAYAVNENLSFGVGLQWVIAHATLENESDLSPLAAQLRQLGVPVPGLTPLQLELDATNGSGDFGFNVGVLYKTEKFGVGVSYRGPVTLKLDGDAVFITPVTGITAPVNVDAQIAALFPNQGGATEIPLPDLVMGGVAFRPNDKIELELDINWANWADFDQFTIDFEEETAALQDQTSFQHWDNGFTYRIGGSFDVTDSVELRLGGIFDPTVIPDENLRPLLPEADRSAITTGLGLQFGSVDVDLSYMYIVLKERTTTVNEDGFNGTYNGRGHLFGLSLSFGS